MTAPNALEGVRVIEASTLFAGPMAAMLLGDFGADVIKIEHPRMPDPARTHGVSKKGIGLATKTLGRNKRTMTLDLSRPDGQRIFRRLATTADVVIENFRPGTMERWSLGYDQLAADNPGLIMARVTAFGQEGPYAGRPGFGTLAEAMSGFAVLTGQSDGPPTLPPFGLADGIAAMATAFAITSALHYRSLTGEGQVIDLAIVEPMMMTLGSQMTAYDQLGIVPHRQGNRSTNNAPRNLYRTADGQWVAVSTSSQSIAERVMRLVGRADLVHEAWFATASGRVQHVDLLDAVVAEWIANRSAAEVLDAFEAAEAAAGPVYDIADIASDPQFGYRGTFTTIDDDDLGALRMQDVIFRFSATPGKIRFSGRARGQDTEAVLTELGYDQETMSSLRSSGVI